MKAKFLSMFFRVCLLVTIGTLASGVFLNAQTPPPAVPSQPPIRPAAAGLRLPSIIGDHMVLQRDTKTPIWGWADPNENITVKAGDVTGSAVAGADGRWTAYLQGLKASADPIEVTVSGASKSITLHDVLVGDVWYCAGQSNMEKPLSYVSDAAAEIAQADQPTIRLFIVFNRPALDPQDDCRGEWQVCTPEVAKDFSGLGYLFGKELVNAEHVPVGLIGAYSGGSWVWAWTSLESLQAHPETKEKVADRFLTARSYFSKNLRMPPGLTPDQVQLYIWSGVMKGQFIHDDWYDNQGGKDYLDAKKKWQDAADAAKANNQPPPAALAPPAVKEPSAPDGRVIPSMLFNGLVAPVMPYAIKGVLWYQGESDTDNGTFYRTLFPRMIADWRAHWGEGDFPFIYVQLPPFKLGESDLTNNVWSVIQEAQLMTLNVVPNIAMVEAIDLGNPANIHPLDKLDVAKRAVLAVRHLVYGENIVASGPLYDSCKITDDKVHIKFKQTGSGLKIGLPPAGQLALLPQELSTTLSGFVMSGADMNFVPAAAMIDGPDSVTVQSDAVKQPTAVRYAWGNTYGNLYNNENLPASPFRTDTSTPALPVRPPPKPKPPKAGMAPAATRPAGNSQPGSPTPETNK